MKSSSAPLVVAALTFVVAAIIGAVALWGSSSQHELSSSADKSIGTIATIQSTLRRQLVSLSIKGNNNSPGSAFPLGECQGDCDSDSECAGDLVCYQRRGTEAVPGCSGSSSYSGLDFCVKASGGGGGGDSDNGGDSSSGGSSRLSFKGNNGSPRSAFPLGKCQGDCDSDRDCAGDLVCFQRGNGDSVPGCSGSLSNSNDYCVEPSNNNGGNDDDDDGGNTGGGGGGGSGDALKLYWQQGYYWQEETFERKWCMRCDSSRQECAEGREIYITNCDRDMTSDWTFVRSGGAYQIKLSASNLCIKAGRWLTMATCDSGERNQLWNTVDGSPNRGSRFELRPVTASNACVTQSHHPRQGERLGLWDCSIPQGRGDRTNYWNLY